jgi:hypothetical protein
MLMRQQRKRLGTTRNTGYSEQECMTERRKRLLPTVLQTDSERLNRFSLDKMYSIEE